jgi:hypothetical protein
MNDALTLERVTCYKIVKSRQGRSRELFKIPSISLEIGSIIAQRRNYENNKCKICDLPHLIPLVIMNALRDNPSHPGRLVGIDY